MPLLRDTIHHQERINIYYFTPTSLRNACAFCNITCLFKLKSILQKSISVPEESINFFFKNTISNNSSLSGTCKNTQKILKSILKYVWSTKWFNTTQCRERTLCIYIFRCFAFWISIIPIWSFAGFYLIRVVLQVQNENVFLQYKLKVAIQVFSVTCYFGIFLPHNFLVNDYNLPACFQQM